MYFWWLVEMVTCGTNPLHPITAAIAEWQGFSLIKCPSAFSLGELSRYPRPDAEVICAHALINAHARERGEPKQRLLRGLNTARAEWAQLGDQHCEHRYSCVFERDERHTGVQWRVRARGKATVHADRVTSALWTSRGRQCCSGESRITSS